MFFKKKDKKIDASMNTNEILVLSPVDGVAKDITEVQDPVFSQKMMGDGMAVTPKSNDFKSPINGEVKVAFETGHAYGIKTISNPEILVHIGVDTVALKGEGFTAKVKVGDKVQTSTLIANVDIATVAKKAPSTDTIVLVTQESQGEYKIEKVASGEVKAGDVLFKLVK